MAKTFVFAVYDSKVGLFASPFHMRSRGEALRGFQTVANDPSTDICKFADDFSLFELASYDDDTGVFTNNPAPVSLGLALQYKNSTPPSTHNFNSSSISPLNQPINGAN